MFKEITGMPLTALWWNWNSICIILNIGGKFEQLVHGLPTDVDADAWASVIGDDG
jgi:hypothetical protein